MTALASPKRARKRGKLPRLVASPRQAREDKQGVELGNANGNEGMEGTGSHFQWLGGEILLDPICRHLSPSLITE